MTKIPQEVTITRIDAGVLVGERPRVVGVNSRLGSHGKKTIDSVVRIHTNTGIVGWGQAGWTWSPATFRKRAQELIGKRLNRVFNVEQGTGDNFMQFDMVLWDLVGRVLKKPVYSLLGDDNGPDPVPVYDSIYMEDIDWRCGKDKGIDAVLTIVRHSLEAGYRAFKAKIGRGYRWMEKEEGLQRDVEVIRRIREVIGFYCKLLVDGNNTFSVREACELLKQTKDCRIF